MMSRFTALLALFALAPVFSFRLSAQEEDPPPPPKLPGVQIVFIPPPMDGVLSLGLYDQAGKLVRTLHREASDKEFKKGINGLITQWDGRDDAGQPLPPGTYSARGWMTGDLGVEGVAYHGNEWLKGENSPHFTRVLSVQNRGLDEVQVVLRAVDGSEHTLGWKLAKAGAPAPAADLTAVLDEGKIVIRKGTAVETVAMNDGDKALAVSAGFGRQVWAIVETAAGREVRAYSEKGEFLRRLNYAKDEPAPVQIAASAWSETIFLLEENRAEQRLRALALMAPKPDGTAAWKTVYQKRILAGDTFAAAAPALGRAVPPIALPEAKIRTKPNPLLQSAKTDVRLQLAVDDQGTLLLAADGLPLTHLTDTPALKWTALVQEKDALHFFEGDGAVIGEFKITKPANLMAFEAGDYELEK